MWFKVCRSNNDPTNDPVIPAGFFLYAVEENGMRPLLVQTDCGTENGILADLGRLHMSPVNRAGSVSEISPRHSFLRKNFDVFI